MTELSTPDDLTAATRELYAAFEHRTLPDRISYCTYCDDEAYERALHAPLAELPDALVDKYVADAFHHTGDSREFLHFLPRALEHFRARLATTEVLARCIRAAERETWTPRETSAFQSYLVVSLIDEAARLSEQPWLETRFGEYVMLGLDLTRIVGVWPATARGAQALAVLIVYDVAFGQLAGLAESDASAPTADDLMAFMRDGSAIAILRAGASALAPSEAADVELAIALVEPFVASAAPL